MVAMKNNLTWKLSDMEYVCHCIVQKKLAILVYVWLLFVCSVQLLSEVYSNVVALK